MNFHKFNMLSSYVASHMDQFKGMTSTEVCELLECSDYGQLRIRCRAERKFIEARRPFYNVYPAVMRCMKNTSLKFRLSDVEAVGAIAICFPVKHEMKCRICRTVICSMLIEHHGVNYVTFSFNGIQSNKLLDGFLLASAMKNQDEVETIEESVGFMNDLPCVGCNEMRSEAIRISVGVMLLAKDERFVEPILLNRDIEKMRNGRSLSIDMAIERAKRRGVNGFAIGKSLSVSPHIRRPHFGIRWTGKGGAEPKLVLISGCVVKRSDVYPVPTGYEDEQ